MNYQALCTLLATVASLTGLTAQAPIARGHRLYQVAGLFETRLIDSGSNLLHVWPSPQPVFQAYPLPDGRLLRAVVRSPFTVPGTHGGIQIVGYDDSVLWDYSHFTATDIAHHDVCMMPNGNVLLIVWKGKTAAQAIAAGRNPALLNGPNFYPDAIVEVQPTGPGSGTVVWEWYVWDHLIQDFDPLQANYGVVGNHPELVDINYPAEVLSNGDWNHTNGIDYDPIHDWIVISARQQNEIWILDHGTTTAQAAGHTGGARGRGGDLIYRWGDPQAYRAGTVANRQIWLQHDPRFIPPGRPGAGNVTIFNNRMTTTQSQVVEITLPLDPSGNFVFGPGGVYGPAAPTWTYSAPGFFSSFVSSAQRLPNGNTLVCSGSQGRLFEVDAAGTVVWSHNPSGLTLPIFQCQYVEDTLWNMDTTLSASAGGAVRFDLLGGSVRGGEIHFLLGSASGVTPGLPFQNVTLPLNLDYLFCAMAQMPNNGMFQNTLGILNGTGTAQSQIVVQAGLIPPQLAGLRLDFAYLVVRNDLAPLECSNAVKVMIAP